MKNIKKIFSMMVAFVMMLGLALSTVHATDPTGTIEITNVKSGSSYSIYKILDATYSTTGTGENIKTENVAYVINDSWKDIFKTANKTTQGAQTTALSSMVDKFFDIFEANSANQVFVKKGLTTPGTLDSELKLLAERFSAWMDTNPTSPPAPADTKIASTETTSSKLVFNNVGFGYFFVTSNAGSIVSTGSATPTATIEEKNAGPVVDKKVNNSTVNTTTPTAFDANQDYSNAKVNDVLKFTIKLNKTKGVEKSVEITDTMSSGLTYDSNSLVIATTYVTDLNATGVTKLIKDTDYTVGTSTDSTTSVTTLTITLTEAGRAKLNTTDLYVYYSATVNSNALAADQSNKVSVEFDPNVKNEDETIILTDYELDLYKYGGSEISNKLVGVTFTLKPSGEGTPNLKFSQSTTTPSYYYVDAKGTATLTTNSEGKINIRGLGAGTFVLTEATTLDGYNKPAVDLTFTISTVNKTDNADGTATYSQTLSLATNSDDVYTTDSTNADQINIQNTTGAQLPSTGGTGTTMMYIAGGALLVGAVVLLITRKRVSE